VRKFVFAALCFTSLLAVSKPSFALGKLGHQLVCQLAFEHLSVTKQQKITALLASTPKNHQDLINHYNYQKKGSTITFANACTWADAIKRVEKFTRYSSWHYMNVPRNQVQITEKSCQKNCLPQALLQHQKQLQQAQPKVSWQQAQALFFLGHWLGDIHQPLHISFASDQGGNNTKLSHLATKCSNLHWYWDECILSRGRNTKAKWLALLNQQWHQQSIPTWQPQQVWQWADESFQLATAPSFQYCQWNTQGSCLKPRTKISLADDYHSQYQPVMTQRLLLAAKRLTALLNASL